MYYLDKTGSVELRWNTSFVGRSVGFVFYVGRPLNSSPGSRAKLIRMYKQSFRTANCSADSRSEKWDEKSLADAESRPERA